MEKANSVVRAKGQLVFCLLDVKGDGFTLMATKAIGSKMNLVVEDHVCRRLQAHGTQRNYMDYNFPAMICLRQRSFTV